MSDKRRSGRKAFEAFHVFLTMAEACYERGEHAASVGLAQIAARWAYPANTGLFASPRLERLLLTLGAALALPEPLPPPTVVRGPRRVLHVLSYARPVGGDSRTVWRWMRNDDRSVHSVAVTTQDDIAGRYHFPEALAEAAAASGGTLHLLKAPTSRPLEQAMELRSLCQGMDLVVLHLFPYDLVPILALASSCESVRTLYVDHSDHTFWSGAAVSDLVVHLRRQAAEFLIRRRCLRPTTQQVLPIPMEPVVRTMTREQARRTLGYPMNSVLLVTIASPFKYGAHGRPGFLEIVLPVLRECQEAFLVAVGPEADATWKAAADSTDGRIVVLGARYDNEVILMAADVYLDSIPFASITSLLEAGLWGLPLLGLASEDASMAPLVAGAPGLDAAMLQASNPGDYRNKLRQLISDAALRQACGDRVRQEILARHTGRQWCATLEQAYARAAAEPRRTCFDLTAADRFEMSPLSEALVQLYARTETQHLFRQLLWRFLGPLPYGQRLRIVLQLHSSGLKLSVSNLLPRWINIQLRALAANLRRRGRGHSPHLPVLQARSAARNSSPTGGKA